MLGCVALDAVCVGRVAYLRNVAGVDARGRTVAGETGSGLVLVDRMRYGGRGSVVGAAGGADGAEVFEGFGVGSGRFVGKSGGGREGGEGAVPGVVGLAGAVAEVGVARGFGRVGGGLRGSGKDGGEG